MSGNLHVLTHPGKNLKDELEWEQNFHFGREKERSQGIMLLWKKPKGSVRVEASQLTSELCTWSISSWDFMGFQFSNFVAPNSIFASWLERILVVTSRALHGFPTINCFPLITHRGGALVGGCQLLLLHFTCQDVSLTSFYPASSYLERFSFTRFHSCGWLQFLIFGT